jgi:hypothetical protein
MSHIKPSRWEYNQNLANLHNLLDSRNLEVLLPLFKRALICKYRRMFHLNKFHNLRDNLDSHGLELNMSQQDKYIERFLSGFIEE